MKFLLYLYRVFSLSLFTVPCGMITAAAFEFGEKPLFQRVVHGGLCSFSLVMAMGIALYFIPLPGRYRACFIRPPIGGGTFLVVFGLVAPLLLIQHWGRPLYPWAEAIRVGTACSFLSVLVYEMLSFRMVGLERRGLFLATLFTRRCFLYGELRHGISRSAVDPRVATWTGGSFRLFPGLVRCGTSASLGSLLFFSGWTDRDTKLLARILDRKALTAKPVPCDPDSVFFLRCAGEKRVLGPVYASCLALLSVVPIFSISLAAGGYSGLGVLAKVPPLFTPFLLNVSTVLLPLSGVLASVLLYRLVSSERKRALLLDGAVPVGLGTTTRTGDRVLSLARRDLLVMRLILAVVVLVLAGAAAYAGAEAGRSPQLTRYLLWLSVLLPSGILLARAARFLPSELRFRRALAVGELAEALDEMRRCRPRDDRPPWQCFKAYALAGMGAELPAAIEMARRDMARLACVESFLAACIAASKAMDKLGGRAAASTLADKLELRFATLLARLRRSSSGRDLMRRFAADIEGLSSRDDRDGSPQVESDGRYFEAAVEAGADEQSTGGASAEAEAGEAADGGAAAGGAAVEVNDDAVTGDVAVRADDDAATCGDTGEADRDEAMPGAASCETDTGDAG